MASGSAVPDALAAGGGAEAGLSPITSEERLAYLREAEVWSPVDTASLDVARGPAVRGTPVPEDLECDFSLPSHKPGGHTPKFFCKDASGRVYKIKYGADNGEVYGEVVGTRLLWLLGFKSDRIDPVRVLCRGCPPDPWAYIQRQLVWDHPHPVLDPDDRIFVPAIIESQYYGTLMEVEEDQGVDWSAELLGELSRDPKRAAAQRAQREALTLLAGFLQHADSKPSNQTLACTPGGIAEDEAGRRVCRDPAIYVGDLGSILGRGWRGRTSKVDYAGWRDVPVWRDAERCIVAVNKAPNGTLEDTMISEAGRRFLADRLEQLSREQLRSLFALARVELIGEEIETPDGRRTVTSDDWADLFLEKMRSITEHSCPAS